MDARPSPHPAAFLSDGGEMAERIGGYDWERTSTGPLASWPQCLRTTVGLLLRSPVPMVLLWGEDGVMIYNDPYGVFSGGRHPSLLGSPVLQGWPEVADFNANVMQVCMAGGVLSYRDQELTLYRSGAPEQVWMNLDYSPVLDESGRPGGVLAIVVETTERVQAEQRQQEAAAALRMERDRTRGVLDNLGEAFVLLDRDFRIVDMNAEALRLESRPLEQIIGKTHWEAHPNAAPELGELYRQAMRERRAISLEHRYVWEDGRDTWIDMRTYPVGDGLAVLYRDVTDRKRAEEAIRASDDRQRFLISLNDEVRGLASPVAVVTATSRALGERLAAARVAYAEIDEARDRATIHGGWTNGTVAPLPTELRLSDFGATMIGLLKAGQTVRVNDVTDDPRMADGIASLGAIGAHAIVSVPLVKDRRFVLNLNVHQSEPRAWTNAEVELIEAVAERTWGAVERTRTEAALRESEARLAFLDRLGIQTAPLSDADAVLATTTRLLGEHLNLSVCAYADMDEDQDGFTIRGDWAAPGSRSIVGHYRLADFGKLAVKNLSAGLPLVVNDNLRELAPEEAATFQSIGIAATICMPLVKEGRLTALMAIHDRVPRVWTEADLSLLREVTARSWAHVERVGAAGELREREARHRQILNSATDYAIVAMDMDGRVTSWNSGARRVLGWTEEEMLGQSVDLFFTPEDVMAGQSRKEMKGALTEGRGVDERWHQRKDGERFWASGELTPLRDDAGAITGFVKVLRDRTEQRRNEDTLRQYAVLVESMTEGVSVSDENGVILYTNPAEDRMFGYAPGELVGQHVSVQNAYPPEENIRRVEAVIAQLQASGSWDGEWRNRRKDGTEFITASRITAVAIGGRPHWLCVQRDITQAKQAEEHQRLLINELNHRVKNTLATVQSIASQTLRNAETPEDARAALESRLMALSRVHDVLTRENWDGADLRTIVAEAVAPYSNPGEDRLHLSGEAIRLPPRMALALAMALQELATNAVKYGALSNGTGEVRIEWMDGDNRLHLTWSETGGPPVKVPSRRGFGTRLIERSLASDLDGEVRIAFEHTGVVCTVNAPLDRA